MSNMPERSERAQGEVASTLLFKIFQKRNDHHIHLAWDETISAATPLHCLSMGLLSNCQNLQKVGHDIVIFNGNVLGHAWHTWCKKGTNRKRMSCSSPICHMQIFKSFDFRTMGLWIWITFILIRTVEWKFTPFFFLEYCPICFVSGNILNIYLVPQVSYSDYCTSILVYTVCPKKITIGLSASITSKVLN